MSDERKAYDCGLIQDLLPLYQDDVCSAASKKIVEEHLEDCAACRDVAEKLHNTTVDDRIVREKNGVLREHARQERRKSVMVGVCMAGILMIPVIVCLICNLAIGHGLDWFFIVLASLLVTASITVIPMLVQDNRGLWTLGSFSVSLILLLLVTDIYTHGNWFFLAAIPVIFGLSVVFMPYVIRSIRLPKVFKHSKALIVMIWDTVWLYAVIIVCGFHVKNPEMYWDISLKITTFCIIYPWIIFLVIRYLKMNGLIKAGISTVLTGVFVAFANDVILFILDGKWHMALLDADLSYWGVNVLDANIKLIGLLVTVIIGGVLIGAGIIRTYGRGEWGK